MMGRKTIVVAILGTLAVTATVSAEMVLVPGPEAQYGPLPSADRPPTRQGVIFSGSVVGSGLAGLLPASIEFWPEPDADHEPADGPLPEGLTEGHSSLDLCLYALIGLGLCRSAPRMRKLSLGGVPEWYHTGGPFQIGHSAAIAPDCLCSAQICFVQPGSGAQDPTPEYRGQTLICLWREAQFLPTILASRGPPRMP